MASAPVDMTPYQGREQAGAGYMGLVQRFYGNSGTDPLSTYNNAVGRVNYLANSPFEGMQGAQARQQMNSALTDYRRSAGSMSALNQLLSGYDITGRNMHDFDTGIRRGWGANDWTQYLDNAGYSKKAPPAPPPDQTQTQQQGQQNQPVNPLAQYAGQSNYFTGRPAGQQPAAFGGAPGQQKPATGQMPVLKQGEDAAAGAAGGAEQPKSALSQALASGEGEVDPTKAGKRPAWWAGLGGQPSRSGAFGTY